MDRTDPEDTLAPLSSQLGLNAHEAAPAPLRDFFKALKGEAGERNSAIVDFVNSKHLSTTTSESIQGARISKAFAAISEVRDWISNEQIELRQHEREISIPGHLSRKSDELRRVESIAYRFEKIPGLTVIPALLPDEIQRGLLVRLLHRDLSDPQHQTNLHLHYHVRYPEDTRSLFMLPPDTVLFEPKDPAVHKPLTIRQVLEKKLRWMTLGGQYDWTNKVYPTTAPPQFPQDIATFINGLFPDMEAQAAIVNFYSPGDTLNMHRDVSEEVDRGLVSISLGCDCIFVIGLENKSTGSLEKVAMRLRSGDALYMSGESRLAWHGVPRIIPNTAPTALQESLVHDAHSYLSNWTANKRINLNVRQMREASW